MIKQDTLEKIQKMLSELGWSEEIINQYCLDTFEAENGSLAEFSSKQST